MGKFADRMFNESEKVYDAIVRGDMPDTGAVEAALLDAQLNASTDDDN